jgi:hypothetical protein
MKVISEPHGADALQLLIDLANERLFIGTRRG